jgi:hypothetical protein
MRPRCPALSRTKGKRDGLLLRTPARFAIADLLVQPSRLRRRLDAQLAFENPYARLILSQCRSAPIGPGVEPHQLAVGPLMQRVQRRPAPRKGDGQSVVTLGTVTAYQSLKGGGQRLAKTFSLKELPLVECGAIWEAETGQEVAGVAGDGFGQGWQTINTDLVHPVAVGLAFCQTSLKAVDVQPEIGLGMNASALSVDL